MKIKDYTRKIQATRESIQHAVKLLKAGKLVAIPTETVYGLAADANNPKAIAKIFKAKGRPSSHPLIVHISSDKELKNWAIDIPKVAYKLTKKFWPGPLTLILKKAPHVASIITGGQNTVAIRCPNHPLTQTLLKAFKSGLVAPSANRFGHVSPTTAEHVKSDLGKKVDYILNGGPCKIGIESTILDLTVDPPNILRPGMISAKALSQVLKKRISFYDSKTRAPGSLPKHYSPKTPAILVKSKEIISSINQAKRKKIVVLARKEMPKLIRESFKKMQWFVLPKTPNDYAQTLYEKLREADRFKYDLIMIEDVPNKPEWVAIKDRLNRATKK